jgi:hypothetical protein
MSVVIKFETIKNEYERKDILARKMLENGFSHIRLPKQNLEVWFKKGALIFDIINEDSISVDECCPYCGNKYFDWASILYIHPGLNHERHVYACSCGRFYSVYWEKEGKD